MTDDKRDKPTGPGPQAHTPDAGSTSPKDERSSGDFAEGASGQGYVRDDYGDYGDKSNERTRDDEDLKDKGYGRP